jgi:hypothetical protein
LSFLRHALIRIRTDGIVEGRSFARGKKKTGTQSKEWTRDGAPPGWQLEALQSQGRIILSSIIELGDAPHHNEHAHSGGRGNRRRDHGAAERLPASTLLCQCPAGRLDRRATRATVSELHKSIFFTNDDVLHFPIRWCPPRLFDLPSN